MARLPPSPINRIEIIIDYGPTDIVAEGYDAGFRMGEQVAKDMIVVRIGPDMRMAVVAPPAYFAKYPASKTPQDLTAHKCIKVPLPGPFSRGAWSKKARSGRWQRPKLAVPCEEIV